MIDDPQEEVHIVDLGQTEEELSVQPVLVMPRESSISLAAGRVRLERDGNVLAMWSKLGDLKERTSWSVSTGWMTTWLGTRRWLERLFLAPSREAYS